MTHVSAGPETPVIPTCLNAVLGRMSEPTELTFFDSWWSAAVMTARVCPFGILDAFFGNGKTAIPVVGSYSTAPTSTPR